jgi:hypothetical protein
MTAQDRFSGPALPHFTGGWALLCFVGRQHIAHRWRKTGDGAAGGERVRLFTAACGAQGTTTKRAPAFARGDFRRCMRCQRASASGR